MVARDRVRVGRRGLRRDDAAHVVLLERDVQAVAVHVEERKVAVLVEQALVAHRAALHSVVPRHVHRGAGRESAKLHFDWSSSVLCERERT